MGQRRRFHEFIYRRQCPQEVGHVIQVPFEFRHRFQSTRIAALSQEAQVSIAARESDAVEIFADRNRELAARGEQVSNFAYR